MPIFASCAHWASASPGAITTGAPTSPIIPTGQPKQLHRIRLLGLRYTHRPLLLLQRLHQIPMLLRQLRLTPRLLLPLLPLRQLLILIGWWPTIEDPDGLDVVLDAELTAVEEAEQVAGLVPEPVCGHVYGVAGYG